MLSMRAAAIDPVPVVMTMRKTIIKISTEKIMDPSMVQSLMRSCISLMKPDL